MAKVTFEKKNDLKDPFGFWLDPGFGPTVEAIDAADPAGAGVRHIDQAGLRYPRIAVFQKEDIQHVNQNHKFRSLWKADP